jgi:hypothetical protein
MTMTTKGYIIRERESETDRQIYREHIKKLIFFLNLLSRFKTKQTTQPSTCQWLLMVLANNNNKKRRAARR